MSTVTLFFVGGVIEPSRPRIPCHLEKRSYQPYFPNPHTNTSTHGIKTWEYLRDHFEEEVSQNSPDFWQQRIVVYFAAAPAFCSVSFYPADFSSDQTWLIQKGKTEPPVEGFWAPYLAKKMQRKWGCLESLPRSDGIATSQDIDRSIASLPASVSPVMCTLLNDFLHDPLSKMIGFTYIVNEEGARQTRFWYKL